MAASPPRHEAVGETDRPLGEPGRSRRYAPRARESDALPVTHAEREPAAPSGNRRHAPTTARDRRSLGPLARRRRARTPQRSEERGSKDATRTFVIAGNRRFPACSQNAPRSDDITRELHSLERQRAPERSSAARAFEVVAGHSTPDSAESPPATSVPDWSDFNRIRYFPYSFTGW